MKSLLSLCIVFASACGSSKAVDNGGAAPSPPQTSGNLKLAKSKVDITCNETVKNFLFYASADAKFYLCDGSALTEIDLKGKDGANGTDGTNGTDNQVSATLYCSGTTSGSSPTGVDVSYWATVFSSGDVWASAEVSAAGVDATSGSRFYSSKQNGATTAAVSIVSDWLTPYDNGGWWSIEVNRTTAVATATYHDVGVTQSFVFAASACNIQKY